MGRQGTSKAESVFSSILSKFSIEPKLYEEIDPELLSIINSEDKECNSTLMKLKKYAKRNNKTICIREFPTYLLTDTNETALDRCFYSQKIETLANYEFVNEKKKEQYKKELKFPLQKTVNFSSINLTKSKIDFLLISSDGTVFVIELNGKHHYKGDPIRLQRQIAFDCIKETLSLKTNSLFFAFDIRRIETIETHEKLNKFVEEHFA